MNSRIYDEFQDTNCLENLLFTPFHVNSEKLEIFFTRNKFITL